MLIRLLIASFFFLLSAACGSADSAGVDSGTEATSHVPGQITTISWIDSVRNFGKINEGQKLAISFRFRNSGDKPLIIESVTPACGCTVADYPKEPVAPGAEGEITGEFDSKGREGLQHKEITVKTNTAGTGQQNVVFEVNVIKKAGPDEDPSTPSN